MKVAVTGSTGFIGEALIARLSADGDEVVRMVRPGSRRGDGITWDPVAGTIDAAALEDVDAVVNLAGRGIGKRRFTQTEQKRLRDSRINGTRLLAETLASTQAAPRILVSASAVGYYGDRGAQVLREDSGPGHGFLADLCVDWESATGAAAEAGVRVAHLRTGIVLGHGGPLFKRLVPAFKMFVGGRLGDGTQYQPWITLDDQIGAIVHVLRGDLHGAVNLSAPEPATNAELTRALGRALRRPAVMVVPRMAVALILGRVGADDLLASQRAIPAALEADGFRFAHPTLADAMAAIFP